MLKFIILLTLFVLLVHFTIFKPFFKRKGMRVAVIIFVTWLPILIILNLFENNLLELFTITILLKTTAQILESTDQNIFKNIGFIYNYITKIWLKTLLHPIKAADKILTLFDNKIGAKLKGEEYKTHTPKPYKKNNEPVKTYKSIMENDYKK